VINVLDHRVELRLRKEVFFFNFLKKYQNHIIAESCQIESPINVNSQLRYSDNDNSEKVGVQFSYSDRIDFRIY
jgi:hypothetical protein